MSEEVKAEEKEEVDLGGYPVHLMHAHDWGAQRWVDAVEPAPGWILIQAPPESLIIQVAGGSKKNPVKQQILALVRKIGPEAYNHRTEGRQPMYYEVGDIVLVNGDAVTQYPEWRDHRLGITYYEHLLGKIEQASLTPPLEPEPEQDPGTEAESDPSAGDPAAAESAPVLIETP